MILKTRLKDIGFESVARNAFAATVGELVHLVIPGRDRHAKAYVEIKAWHEDFAIPGEGFSPRDLASPVRGMVGPEGVISSWAWGDVDEVSQHIEDVVSGFAACFSTLQDMRIAVGKVEEASPPWRQLYGPRPEGRASTQGPFGSFRPVVSRAVSQEGALQLACNAFLPFAAANGFAYLTDAGSLVLFRDRGEVVDCIRFSTDLFQTFGQLEVFPWSRAVWRAERRLKGRYLPITSRRTEDPASLWIKPIHEIGPDCVEGATEWLGSQLRAQEVIRSSDDFIARIDPMYSTIRSQLAMAGVAKTRE